MIQLPIFVLYLLQQRSSTNKLNRSKLVTTHTAGTKSFARVNHDEVCFFFFKENKINMFNLSYHFACLTERKQRRERAF